MRMPKKLTRFLQETFLILVVLGVILMIFHLVMTTEFSK